MCLGLVRYASSSSCAVGVARELYENMFKASSCIEEKTGLLKRGDGCMTLEELDRLRLVRRVLVP